MTDSGASAGWTAKFGDSDSLARAVALPAVEELGSTDGPVPRTLKQIYADVGGCTDFHTFLGELSPSKVVKSMWMLVAASSHRHWHRFPYFSGRHIARKSKEIHADACGCLWPQASA